MTIANSNQSRPSPTACVRESTAAIMANAVFVIIDPESIDALARRLRASSSPPGWDSSVHLADGTPLTAQYLLVLDALNFCFWPDAGLGYSDLSLGLKSAVMADRKALDADRLAATTEDDIERWFGRPVWNAKERARLVRGLGETLAERYDGMASELIISARGSADALVARMVADFPGFADEVVIDGRRVCFYKRAQIFVADIWGAFGGRGLGAFHDVGSLTMFADYRVPQLLRHVGVLRYSQPLAESVDAGAELSPGEQAEVEIRSATIQAVESLRLALATLERPVNSIELDWWLWHIAEDEAAEGSLEPHHRVRTIFY